MSHPLDRPVWTALTTRHAAFAEGGDHARRYQPSIIPFAATPDDGAECLAALDTLIGDGETAFLVQSEPLVLPGTLQPNLTAPVVQMLAEALPEDADAADIELLTDADAEEMLALALLTKPGPFTLRAATLGEFWGVRINGRLAAMCGERMKQPGFSELSGLCTHPDHRGRGLGRRLLTFVADRIRARGEVPYLHAYASNTEAIRLYETFGFRLRKVMDFAVVQRRG